MDLIKSIRRKKGVNEAKINSRGRNQRETTSEEKY